LVVAATSRTLLLRRCSKRSVRLGAGRARCLPTTLGNDLLPLLSKMSRRTTRRALRLLLPVTTRAHLRSSLRKNRSLPILVPLPLLTLARTTKEYHPEQPLQGHPVVSVRF